MSAGSRSFEIEGIKFILVEGFRDLYRVLTQLEPNSRWDVLALDKYMTAEIVSFGKNVKVMMYAELETETMPSQLLEQKDVDVEVKDGKLILRSYVEYGLFGKTTVMAIISKINDFRKTLSSIMEVDQE
ncbi:MAG: hypothetical protein ABWK01_09335 [Infirmifilum sp.]